MTTTIQLAEPYSPRPIRCLDILVFEGWRLKVYGIAYRRERPVEALVDAAVAAAKERLPSPAVTDQRYGSCSVVIYNPDLDPERASAARIVRFLADLAGR